MPVENKRLIVLISLVGGFFLILIIVFIIILAINLNESKEEQTAQEKNIKDNVQTLIINEDEFERVVSEDLKSQDPASSRESLDRGVENYESSQNLLKIEDIIILDNTASCTATIERTTKNKKTGKTWGAQELYKYSFVKEDDTWKISNIEFISSKSL